MKLVVPSVIQHQFQSQMEIQRRQLMVVSRLIEYYTFFFDIVESINDREKKRGNKN